MYEENYPVCIGYPRNEQADIKINVLFAADMHDLLAKTDDLVFQSSFNFDMDNLRRIDRQQNRGPLPPGCQFNFPKKDIQSLIQRLNIQVAIILIGVIHIIVSSKRDEYRTNFHRFDIPK